MRNIVSFICGSVMAFGLMMSGMVDPRKVIGFLDVTGGFDPSLAFVMAGAVITAFIGFRMLSRRAKPLLAESFDCSSKAKIDRPLILGAAVFGAGWGLAGLCPGPAIVTAGLGYLKSLIFAAAMLAGMLTASTLLRKSSR